MHGCRANFPDGLLPLRLFLLEVLLPSFSVGGSEGGADFGVGLARLVPIVPETTTISSRTPVLLLSIGSILFVLFQHHVDTCDS